MSDRKITSGHTHSEYEYRECVSLDDLVPGKLVSPCGVRGTKMVVQLADNEDEAMRTAPLLIAKHQVNAPTQGVNINYSNEGRFLKYLVVRCDTQGTLLCAPVYLGKAGGIEFSPGAVERRVGTVIHVGPSGGADAGAVLLEV